MRNDRTWAERYAEFNELHRAAIDAANAGSTRQHRERHLEIVRQMEALVNELRSPWRQGR